MRDHSTCTMRSISKGRIDEMLRIFDRGYYSSSLCHGLENDAMNISNNVKGKPDENVEGKKRIKVKLVYEEGWQK